MMRYILLSRVMPTILTAVGVMLAVNVFPAEPESSKALQPVRGTGTAILKGKITVKGDPPARWAGREDWRIGDNEQVGNVVVAILPEEGYYFPIDAGQLDEARKNPVEIQTTRVNFRPHISVYFSRYRDPDDPQKLLPTGQTCTVVNTDRRVHNVQWCGTLRNPGDNQVLDPEAKMKIDPLPQMFPIFFRDAIFPNHGALLWVFDHPYATISCSDTAPKPLQAPRQDCRFGAYEISDVPAQVKLRVLAWHERIGWLTKGRRSGEPLTLKEGVNIKDFELIPRDD